MILQPSQIIGFVIPILTFIFGVGLTAVLRIRDMLKQKRDIRLKAQQDKIITEQKRQEEQLKTSNLLSQLRDDFAQNKEDIKSDINDINQKIETIENEQQKENSDSAFIKGKLEYFEIWLKDSFKDGANLNKDK